MPAPILPIDSLDDPRVDVFRNVMDKDLRRSHGHLFMAESEMVVRQLVRSGIPLHSLLMLTTRLERMQDIVRQLPETVPVYLVASELAEAIVGFHVHRGILAAGYRPRPEALTLDGALGHLRERSHLTLVLAEGIGDVDNMGSLFRNAAAFGVDGILLDPTSCDPLYRKALRTSMGHSLSVPFAVSQDWWGDLERLRGEWGVRLIAAETAPGALPIWTVPRPDRLGLLLGAEGAGLTARSMAACDAVCQIPMAAPHRSLNVTAAQAVMLYEWVGRPRST